MRRSEDRASPFAEPSLDEDAQTRPEGALDRFAVAVADDEEGGRAFVENLGQAGEGVRERKRVVFLPPVEELQAVGVFPEAVEDDPVPPNCFRSKPDV